MKKTERLLTTIHHMFYRKGKRSTQSLICSISFLLVLTTGIIHGATYVVMNINDTGTNSLRWAITQANTNPGFDNITFNIPGAGPHTIIPLSPLPILWDSAGVFIDGFSEPGSSAGANPPSTATLMIIVDGTIAGPAHGFWIFNPSTAHDNTIQGLVIQNFEQDGIRIQATQNGTFNNVAFCNFIGTDQSGTIAQGNGTNQLRPWAGVNIVCVPETVGIAFDNVVDANLTSANYAEGIGISSCPPGDVFMNTVVNNYSGTDITGMVDLGNAHDGVYIGEGAHDNFVDLNLISGNDFEGVCIVGYAEMGWNSHTNRLWNNIIGLDVNLMPLGNTMDGVSIGQYGNWYQGGFASNNVVDSNTIAFNGHNGVTVWEHYFDAVNTDGNTITQNSIYDNTWLGIDLADDGVTPNDGGDPDTGPNEELNFPVITSAQYSAGQTTVTGTIDIDTDPTQATIEVFHAAPDPSGHGEGAIYLGSTNPDASGSWNIVVTGPSIGDSLTATTTDMNFNTSEFCQNVEVVAVGVEEGGSLGKPVRYALSQNHPNPFTLSTTIHYAIPKTTRLSLTIYDVTGKHIKTLAHGIYSAGDYTIYWHGNDENGTKVSSGVYFYRLKTKDISIAKKLIVDK